MNRTTIKKALKRASGGAEFINQNQIKRGMGWGNDRTADMLAGLDFIRQKNTKQYDIDEVSARIYEQVERS